VIVVITGVFLLMGLPIFPRKIPWVFFVVGAPFLVGLSTMLVAKHKLACGAILFFAAIGSFKVFKPLGEEFMPLLDELSILDMPITTPNVNITQAGNDIKERDVVSDFRRSAWAGGPRETPTDPRRSAWSEPSSACDRVVAEAQAPLRRHRRSQGR
jgi:Cu/Ag efflux pump CusA